METTKKTAKYYRDILSGNDTRKALSVLPEVIKKYGNRRHGKYSKGNDWLPLRAYTEFEWNHRIEGFYLSDNGGVYADIYWQGDSTDGNDSVSAISCLNGKVIPAEHEFIGGRTYYCHGDLRISREEFADAIKAVAKYLDPKDIKARKEAARRSELDEKVFDFIDSKKKGLERWEMEDYWNGRTAVQKVLEQNPELLDKTFEELKPIVEKVYDNNERTDYYLRGSYYSGEKKYNLTY